MCIFAARLLRAGLLAALLCTGTWVFAQQVDSGTSPYRKFGTVTLKPAFELDGPGKNVDTIAFWEAPDPKNTLMFVSAKKNQLIEVWKYPFRGGQQAAIRHPLFGKKAKVNGVVVDQVADLLYVSISNPVSTVAVFSCPDFRLVRRLINRERDLKKEPGIELYNDPDGRRRVLVSADNVIYVHDAESGRQIDVFKPKTSVETLLADEAYGVIYVPDENSRKGVFAYHPDWRSYERMGRTVLGEGVFRADAEGIALYVHRTADGQDSGDGLIIVADQQKKLTDFEFFDRRTWAHLGTLRLSGVSNTDGIASTQQEFPAYPLGLFVAINHDETTVGIGWHTIFEATGLLTNPERSEQP